MREQPSLFGDLPPAPEFRGDPALVRVAPVAMRGDVVRKRLVLRMEKRGRCAFSPGADPHCRWRWFPADQIEIENLEPNSPQWCDVTIPVALAKQEGLQ